MAWISASASSFGEHRGGAYLQFFSPIPATSGIKDVWQIVVFLLLNFYFGICFYMRDRIT